MIKVAGKVNILDVPYTISLYENEFELLNKELDEHNRRYMQKENENPVDGYCDYISKEIKIFGDNHTSPDYFEMTVRHELTHAFLYEIGNSRCDDEDLVDKISKWIPQINKIYERGMELLEDARD